MTLLIIGIVLFLGLHLLPTVPDLRNRLIGRLGEKGYKGLFAALSLATFVLLVWGFGRAPVIQVWGPPDWTRYVAMALMLPAFVLLIAAYMPGQIKVKVKHPFVDAISTWALAHLIANGDLASIILFASFLAYAVFGRITLKHRADDGARHRSGRRTGPQRRHQRRRRTFALRGLFGVAASAPDWHLAAALGRTALAGNRLLRLFCTARASYICHNSSP